MDRVFVTVIESIHVTELFALDARTGAVLWHVRLDGDSSWTSATYGDGRLFAVRYGGPLAAFDAATGEQLWASELKGQSSFPEPTPFGGMVYVSGSGTAGTLYAVDGATGAVQWTRAVEGSEGAPAVDSMGVFVSSSCTANAFSSADGSPLWTYMDTCMTGADHTGALIGHYVYTRNDSAVDGILDADKGTLADTFSSELIPAGANGVVYTVRGATLSATKQFDASPKWTFGSNVVTPAIVVGHDVVVALATGEVDVLSDDDGAVLSTAQHPLPMGSPTDPSFNTGVSSLAAANDGLYVVVGTSLYAY
jgi:outer membrane protein assembly factor BamB